MVILDQIFTISLYFLPLLFVLFIIIVFLQVLQRRGRLTLALNMSLFLVALPKEQKEEGGGKPKDVKEEIAKAEQLYSILGNVKTRGAWHNFIYGPLYLTLEIASTGKEIEFYVAMPRRWEETITKHIQGVFPEAEVEKVRDYNIFNPRGFETASRLALAKSYCLPIKTYKRLETDPLGGITNALSKIKEGEGGAIQIVFKKENSQWRGLGQEVAEEMQKGKSYGTSLTYAQRGVLRKIFGEFFEASKGREEKSSEEASIAQKHITPMHQEIIKAIEEKSGKMGFGVNIRLLASAPSRERAEEILSQLENVFSQFDDPNLNSFEFLRQRIKNIIYDFSFRNYRDKYKMILNTEELASIFHFPLPGIETPKLKWLKARSSPPPANMSDQGLILGQNVFRGEEVPVRLTDDDRRRHLYIIGQTGTGKSTFMQNMTRQDIEDGRGICVIDPHGDLIEKILAGIPEERIEDVILFDPADFTSPIGLNMLEYNLAKPEQKTFIINELINIVQKLFAALPEAFGPMYEQYTRNTMRLLLDNADIGPFTLIEMPKIFASPVFRQYLLSRESNVTVREFWQSAEAARGEAALENFASYITSKFDNFINNEYIRPIIGQAKSGINFRRIMDEQKILLVNLSKGKLGDINSSLLGLIIVGKILMAAFSRVEMPEEERKDFYLYIDEFQNFTTESTAAILAEARKYRLSLTIAHQFIGQLQDKIRDSVFGNVGTMATFRIGAEDAEFVAKQYKPVFSETDLINIDNFNAYVKILINGKTSRPFNMQISPPVRGNDDMARRVREFSQTRYGKSKEAVEKEILERAEIPKEETFDI